MSVAAVLAPLFVQVALTFVLLFAMAGLRIGALRRRETRVGDIALGQANWPQRPTQVANCFHNQLQLPLLFYVLVALALITRRADLLFVVLSWAFVASRILHALIHTSSNDVTRRFYAFAGGAVILVLMWIVFAARLLFASA